ncbi:MAG: NADH-quinone oxidoreductase subunit NuoK [Candidatus Omnitrophica bacterium]|nr:NADH-quinone oxidoreductase subunit NuoK [Candidatus Omnitrophota bacterium]
MPISHFVVISSGLFVIGLFGALTRRNAIGVLMAIELILNAANLNLVAFSRLWDSTALFGQATALFVIGIAGAGAVVGLALVLAIYRHRQTIAMDEFKLLKG